MASAKDETEGSSLSGTGLETRKKGLKNQTDLTKNFNKNDKLACGAIGKKHTLRNKVMKKQTKRNVIRPRCIVKLCM